jgi:hypothetical protein
VIRENCRVAIDEVALELRISHGSAHRILHDVHQYQKGCARWVPRRLALELKERCMDACKKNLWDVIKLTGILFSTHSEWTRKLGSLYAVRNKYSEQGVETS